MGVTLGEGNGVLSCVLAPAPPIDAADTVDAFLSASGTSSGEHCGWDDDAASLFSDIVLSKFLPASLV